MRPPYVCSIPGGSPEGGARAPSAPSLVRPCHEEMVTKSSGKMSAYDLFFLFDINLEFRCLFLYYCEEVILKLVLN